MIKEISNMFTDEEKEKLHKFFVNISLAEENIDNTKGVIEIFAKYGLTFAKAVDLRTLTIEQKALAATIEKYVQKDKFNIIVKDVSLLRFKAEIVLDRIEACEKVGKGYLNPDGTIQNFILNDDEWERVSKGLNLESVEEVSHMTFDQAFSNDKEQIIIEALKQTEINLDVEDFDKYSMLVKVFNNSFISAGISIEDEYKERAEGIIMNLVAYEKAHEGSIDDLDIIYSAVIHTGFCTKEDAESMKPIIEALLNSEKMDLESSGIRR